MNHSALQHPKFFNRYVEKLPHGDLNQLMKTAYQDLQADLEILKGADFNYSYQEGKWSIAKLIQHCIDTEQIFGYRALCIARKDPNPIMSFDENQYADASETKFDKDVLISSFDIARKQNMLLFQGFNMDWLDRCIKTEHGEHLSLVSMAYIIIGHWLHHKAILITRYGVPFNEKQD